MPLLPVEQRIGNFKEVELGFTEEMAVEACLTGDPTLVFQSIAYDPLTASVLSLAEIKQMVNEMLAQNKDYLPTFKHFEA